jgi:hypothetical protein
MANEWGDEAVNEWGDAPAQPARPLTRGQQAAAQLTETQQKLDAQWEPRRLLPGLWALGKGTPENLAAREAYATATAPFTDPNVTPAQRGEAFDALPVSGLTLAPMSGPPRQILRPPRVPTSPEAQALKSHGVQGLTSGQTAPPNSTVAILERASADNPLGMKAQREAAKEGFMRAAQDKGVAPGAQPPAGLDLQGRLGELFEGYGPAYGKLKGNAVAPDVLDNLRSAASMPKRGVDARTAAAAKAEIENALSVLGPEFKPPAPAHNHGPAPVGPPPGTLFGPNGQQLPPAPKPPPKASVGDLMKARENIREAKRAAVRSEDFDRIRLLTEAEREFTGAIESALPPDGRALLKQADTQYARLMTAATAAPSGQTTFTPGQYLRRVEKSSGARNFKKGEAGDLQDLGEAARIVFQDTPMTGVRPGILSAIPGAKVWGAPLSRLANTDAARRFLFEPRMSYARPPERFIGAEAGAAQALSPDVEALLRAMRWRRAGADEEGDR